MSSRDDISLSRYFKTILNRELANETEISFEMLLNQLFESPGWSTPASLSYLCGCYSNMAPGTVKQAIGKIPKPYIRFELWAGFFSFVVLLSIVH